MFRRLGFSKRLLALILFVLFASWALGAGTAFLTRSRDAGPARGVPFPEQAAAIVALLEQANPQQRALLLKAIGSDAFAVTIADRPPAAPEGSRRMPGVEWYVAQHLDGDGRQVIAFLEPTRLKPGERRPTFGQRWQYSREPFNIAIALKGGGYAVFSTRGELSRRIFGLPAGFWLGAIGALIGATAILFVMREARPLRELAASVSRFAVRATPEPVTPRGAPEIKALVGAVNDMQARIAALVKGRTILLGAISHDLKTFLTRLRLRVEALPDEQAREKAIRDIEDMMALIDGALAVSRGATVSDRRETVDLGALVSAEIAEQNDPRLRLVRPEAWKTAAVSGDPVALRRLFANLIGNALRYGSVCLLGVERYGGDLIITLDDDGPGVPETEREAVFEPLYRLEPSRSRASGGSGLGLAIARQIVEAHGGAIAIEASPMGGARVAIKLPAAPAAATA